MASPSAPESPPNTPQPYDISSPIGSSCICGSVPSANLSANTLADSLKVSPLYKQQDSARWNAAAQVYRSSRVHSPTRELQFAFDANAAAQNASKTPLSLEEIAIQNRKRHEQLDALSKSSSAGGLLELEAIAAVHELAMQVEDIHVSEMLPRTSDLIFVNMKTQEGQPYTLELTMKGWRIASQRTDCMNGDYTQVELHTQYYTNARQLLDFLSPDHTTRFNQCVADRLNQLACA